jgi:hypothetical protein
MCVPLGACVKIRNDAIPLPLRPEQKCIADKMGFFLFAAGWIVVVFANSGVITGSPMSILGADRLMAGLLAKSRERTGHA